MKTFNQNLDKFIIDFFSLHDCHITVVDDGVFRVQLTEKMDQALMNRPFYWHYIKSTGQTGKPMKITFITNDEKKKENGEWIHFGSPRLQQIISYLKTTTKYTRLFQEVNVNTKTPLYPWLVINVKIIYTGKLTREDFFSIGINLFNGLMKVNMMEQLQNKVFKTHIPDYCYPISTIIKIPSGFKRIEAVLDQYIMDQTHNWAIESLNELEQEKDLINYFYHHDTNNDYLHKKIKELTLRYTPTITYEVVNGGLFYLDQTLNPIT